MVLDQKKIFFFVSDLQAKEFLEFCNLYGDVDDVWNLKQCFQLYLIKISIFRKLPNLDRTLHKELAFFFVSSIMAIKVGITDFKFPKS